jgi:hypothetical protein
MRRSEIRGVVVTRTYAQVVPHTELVRLGPKPRRLVAAHGGEQAAERAERTLDRVSVATPSVAQRPGWLRSQQPPGVRELPAN